MSRLGASGHRATADGLRNEGVLVGMLRDDGWRMVEVRQLSACDPMVSFAYGWSEFFEPRPPGVYSRYTVLGTPSIHERELKEDFILWRPEWETPLAVAAKLQDSSGSCLEKLEHTYANIIEVFPIPAVVVLEGAAFHDGVIRRAVRRASASGGRLPCVFRGNCAFAEWLAAGSPFPNQPGRYLRVAA